MIPVELISGLIAIEDLPARATDAEDDSQLIYGARWRRRRRFWRCFGRRRICRRIFRASNRRFANRRCFRRRCGRAFRIR